MQYAMYKIDGSKANEFRTAAMTLLTSEVFKNQLRDRMINMDRQTMSFDLDVRGDCPAEIVDLGKRFGTPANSYN